MKWILKLKVILDLVSRRQKLSWFSTLHQISMIKLFFKIVLRYVLISCGLSNYYFLVKQIYFTMKISAIISLNFPRTKKDPIQNFFSPPCSVASASTGSATLGVSNESAIFGNFKLKTPAKSRCCWKMLKLTEIRNELEL